MTNICAAMHRSILCDSKIFITGPRDIHNTVVLKILHITASYM